jgi:hypothetical protein
MAALLSAKTTKTDDKTVANLIFAAGVPRKHVGKVYLKLSGRALPADKEEAKAYIGQTFKRTLIDEERRSVRDRLVPANPLSVVWDKLALDQVRPDDVERKNTLQALLQTGIALLSPHQRNLVRAWMDRSDRNNVTEIHAALPQACGHGAYHCKNKAFARLTRIVSGLAMATGNSDLRPSGPRERSRRGLESRSRQKNATSILKNSACVRFVGGEGNR